MEIRNKYGEKLETLIEGAPLHEAKEILVMVHGFGTNLHEVGIFDDAVEVITKKLPDIAVVRFSWAGFGKSEGKEEDLTYFKVEDDIAAVVDFVIAQKQNDASLVLLGASRGNAPLASYLVKNPQSLKQLIVTKPAAFTSAEEGKKKWSSRPGFKIDEKGVWVIPRSDGSVTKLSPEYWESIDPVKYKNDLTNVTQDYNSVLIRDSYDDFVDNREVAELPFKKKYEVIGDHNFSKPAQRAAFLKTLIEVLGE